MTQKIRAIKGMDDLFAPEQVALWQWVEQKARDIFGAAGFQEIRTPIVEEAALFERSVGEATDIVEKEMYTLTDRKGKRLALRPEGTAGVVRAFIEHFTSHQINEGRFYYFGPFFRYERPQKGRYRQFNQIGAEIFGTDHPLSDVEMISLVMQLLQKVGLQKIQLKLNCLGTMACRDRYREALQKFLEGIHEQLDQDTQERVRRNPLRVLDSKDPKVQALLKEAPDILEFLSAEAKQHWEQVQKGLQALGIPFVVDSKLVRGLDYYEMMVFEITAEGLGAQNAVAGGGRYNDLVQDLGGPKVPAVGFALGMERLIALLMEHGPKLPQAKRVYAMGLDPLSEELLLQQLAPLREVGGVVQLDMGGGSLKAKLKRADRWQADYVLILGESEREKNVVILRDMKASEQKEVALEKLIETVGRGGF